MLRDLKRAKAYRPWVAFLSAIYATCLSGSRADGRIEIRLLSYENSQSSVSSGSCCDNLQICINDCDNYFRLCFAKPGSSSPCSLWDKKTTFLGYDNFKFSGNLGNSLKNPIGYDFKKWEGLDFYVEVWDEDSSSADDLVAAYTLQIRDQPAWGSSAASAHHRQLSGTYSKLDVVVKVFCDKNYLVPDCAVHCIPQDDVTGHYTCDYVNGRRVCLSGWYETDCLTYCVSRNDSAGHYFCGDKGQIICLPGWRGDNCTLPVFRQSNVSSSSSYVVLSSSQYRTVSVIRTFLASSTPARNHIASPVYTTTTSRVLGSSSMHPSPSTYSSSPIEIVHSSYKMSSHSTVTKQQSYTNAIQLPSRSIAGQEESSYQTSVKLRQSPTPKLIVPSSSVQNTGLSLKTSVVPSFPVTSSSSSFAVVDSNSQDNKKRTETLKIKAPSSLYFSGQSHVVPSSHDISLYSSARTQTSFTSSLHMASNAITEQANSSSWRSDILTQGPSALSLRSFTVSTAGLSRMNSTPVIPSLPITSRTRSIMAASITTKEGQEKSLLSLSTVSKVHSGCKLTSLPSSLLSTRNKVIPTKLLNTSGHSTNSKESSAITEQASTVVSSIASSVERTNVTSLLSSISSSVIGQSISNALDRFSTSVIVTTTPTRPRDIEGIVIELQFVENAELPDTKKVKEDIQSILLKKLNDYCWRNAKACNIPEDVSLLNRSKIFSLNDVIVQVEGEADGLTVTVKTTLPEGWEGFVPLKTLLEIVHEEKATIEDLTRTKVTRIHTRYFNPSSEKSQRTSPKTFNLVACILGVCALVLILLLATVGVRKVLRRNATNVKVGPHSEMISLESPSISLASTETIFPLFNTAELLQLDKKVPARQWDFQMSTISEEFECSTPGQVPLINDSPN